MELTWENIKEIIRIADKLVEETKWSDLLVNGEEFYYQTVLNIYNKNI